MATAYRASYSPRVEWFGSSGFPDNLPSDARAYAKRLITYISDASTVYARTMNEFGKSPPKEMIRKWRAEYVAEVEGRKAAVAPAPDLEYSDDADAIFAAIAERLVVDGHVKPEPLILGPAIESVVVEPAALVPGVMPTRLPPVTITEIVEDCAARIGVSTEDILSRRKSNEIAHARQFAATVLRARGSSYPAVGRILGGRDHSTMMHAVKAFFRRLETDPRYLYAWQAAPVPCAARMARSPAELDILIGAQR